MFWQLNLRHEVTNPIIAMVSSRVYVEMANQNVHVVMQNPKEDAMMANSEI